ncbi:hypothetical protein NADFUDRAFT_42276 [Nadsonia fulvescens var. elongata DSM 6958]|uniref:Something about silencing protein 4 domain-containing protein n=1 Tax=Nadsonia fulvescens var. elongata DSM 6958 TaxID=857566 RepID=A0A1E3PIE2_9ASCO|nr:hypothetical protein NADFUDRAFT_42276 [Nadsonia fulvescens var. elongata DSM 6958]
MVPGPEASKPIDSESKHKLGPITGLKESKESKDPQIVPDTDKRVLRTREKAVSKHLFNFDNYLKKDDIMDYTQLIKVSSKEVKDKSLLIRPRLDPESQEDQGDVSIPLNLVITNELYGDEEKNNYNKNDNDTNDNYNDEIETDPLNDENYLVYHRRMERTERQIQNQEKERIGFEKERMERQLGNIKSQDWPKSLVQITAINNPLDKEEMELKRDMTEKELGGLLDRFKQWKTQGKFQHTWRKMLLEGGEATQGLYVKNYGFGSGIKRIKLSVKDFDGKSVPVNRLSPFMAPLPLSPSSAHKVDKLTKGGKDEDIFHPSQVQLRDTNGKFLPRVGGGKRLPEFLKKTFDDNKVPEKIVRSFGSKKMASKRLPSLVANETGCMVNLMESLPVQNALPKKWAKSVPGTFKQAETSVAVESIATSASLAKNMARPTGKLAAPTLIKTQSSPEPAPIKDKPFVSFYDKTYLRPKFDDLIFKKKHQRNVLPFGRLMPIMEVVDFDLTIPQGWRDNRKSGASKRV